MKKPQKSKTAKAKLVPKATKKAGKHIRIS
jgi:hypothetical protein